MIAIIGAGPAGNYCAYLLAKAGYDVNVYEEHIDIGKPVQCTGLVTDTINDIIKIPESIIMARIKFAKIISPNKDFVTIEFDRPNLVLNRCAFDQHLANLAKESGAVYHMGHRFIDGDSTRIILKEDDMTHTINYDTLIGADGPATTVGRCFNLVTKHDIMFGAQARIIMKDLPMDTLEFYPIQNGYKWVVPEGNDVGRIGIAVYQKANEIFTEFLHTRCGDQIILEYQGGVIPKYNPKLKTAKSNVLLIGDAASQVKWTTGGGIIQGLIAASCAAKSIIEKKKYKKLWKKELSNELWMHMKIRNAMDKFSDEDYNKLIELTKQDKIMKILGSHDRDKITKFILKILFKEPRYLKFAGKAL